MSQLDPNVEATSDAPIRQRIDEAAQARLVASARPERDQTREVLDRVKRAVQDLIRGATGPTTSSTSTTVVEGDANVNIVNIVYDAPGNDVVYNDSEYVVLRNDGTGTADVGGWSLTDIADHQINIPPWYAISPGGTLRVYTGPGDTTADRYFDGRGQAVWNNSGGDTATLHDPSGTTIDTYSYSS
jgi:hypothetical protein